MTSILFQLLKPNVWLQYIICIVAVYLLYITCIL